MPFSKPYSPKYDSLPVKIKVETEETIYHILHGEGAPKTIPNIDQRSFVQRLERENDKEAEKLGIDGINLREIIGNNHFVTSAVTGSSVGAVTSSHNELEAILERSRNTKKDRTTFAKQILEYKPPGDSGDCFMMG